MSDTTIDDDFIDARDFVQSFDEFSEQIEASYANTPLVGIVRYAPNHGGFAIYGPFADGKEAMRWMRRVASRVRVEFVPLEDPSLNRTYNDFYDPKQSKRYGGK